MNSMELIEGVRRAWLKTTDQSAMALDDMAELLRVISLAQGQVWRLQPPHYRKQTISLDFYGPAEGSITVPGGYGSRAVSGILFPSITNILTYTGIPLTFEDEGLVFNGIAAYENPRPFCSIMIEGDPVLNEFNGTSLTHPYLGQSTESVAATLYDDARLSPWLIERILGPVIDRRSRHQWYYEPTLDYFAAGSTYNRYTTHRVNHGGIERTIFRLTPQHREPVSLTIPAIVAPVALSYGSSMRPVNLPYGDEVAAIIISVAGASLSTHPLFDRERVSPNEARAAAEMALGQLAGLSSTPTAQMNGYGTPGGF